MVFKSFLFAAAFIGAILALLGICWLSITLLGQVWGPITTGLSILFFTVWATAYAHMKDTAEMLAETERMSERTKELYGIDVK